MKTLYILPIEPIENRYPGDWHRHLPLQFIDYIDYIGKDIDVVSIDGDMTESNSGTSAFLNFIDTNIWKSTQMVEVAKLFSSETVKDGDVFLMTDAWNPCVHQLRYMADLTGKKIKIVGIFHAGSYDEWDILGQTFQNKKWSYSNEASMYEAYDMNIFATQYHKDKFFNTLTSAGYHLTHHKSKVCGFPMEYMTNIKINSEISERRDMVIFPHRASPEKQHEIADDFAEVLAKRGIEMYTCQGKNLSRNEYYAKLRESKVCFSCSQQETLGIAQFEAMLAGSVPLVPKRLSYTEMYPDYSLYPSMWTQDVSSYYYWRNELADRVVDIMMNYNPQALRVDSELILKQFFTGTAFYGVVLQEIS